MATPVLGIAAVAELELQNFKLRTNERKPRKKPRKKPKYKNNT